MTRRVRRAQRRRSRRAGIAVASVFGAGVLVLGVASGALPGAGGSGSDVPPVEASQTGADHAQAGISQAGQNVPNHPGTQDAGSRRDGLETAAANVTNPVASAVIGTL